MSIQVFMFSAVFILTLILGPILIPVLTKLKFGQTVRDDGPKTHLIKMGTPTMGGIIFLIPVLALSIYYSLYNKKILTILFVTVAFGLIGFIDDYLKVVKKHKDGLNATHKMLGLFLVATAFSFYISKSSIGTDILVPFLGLDTTINLAWFFIPFSIIIFLATTNAVNITDGLDGLASGITLIVMIFFTIVAMLNPEWEYIKIFSTLIAGGCLGFLVFNSYPAKVFMGDTGSLALGGAIGGVAIALKMPLLLIIVGGVYVIETLSVILQVGSFKLTGRRVFKMAPLHHHFELCGWQETRVVTVFWCAEIILCVIGFFALKIKLF